MTKESLEKMQAVGDIVETGVKLLPCPFCGGEAFVHQVCHGDVYFVHCEGCGADISLYPSAEEAVDAWNERK